jgi:hypothetical protein
LTDFGRLPAREVRVHHPGRSSIVADKAFIVVCYACYADRGGIPWWIAAAILSRELLVTVLRSSLELRGRRLPSTIVAKAKTWEQMIGIGLVALIHVVGPGRSLALLFAVPLAVALIVTAIGRFAVPSIVRPFAFAAAVLTGFLFASTFGAPAAQWAVLGFVVFITWYSALDYLALGFRELSPPGLHRAQHWARLAGGAALPVVALGAIATDGLPTIPIIVLLSSEMARGALDNYAAHRGVTDFSWAWASGRDRRSCSARSPPRGERADHDRRPDRDPETIRSVRRCRAGAIAPAVSPPAVPRLPVLARLGCVSGSAAAQMPRQPGRGRPRERRDRATEQGEGGIAFPTLDRRPRGEQHLRVTSRDGDPHAPLIPGPVAGLARAVNVDPPAQPRPPCG